MFGATGRNSKAADANQKAIALSPKDAEAHNNFANTLKELGRLSEAEASHSKAIELKPDYAEAHYNLGVTLKELGRLNEAKASYTNAIALKPEFAEAHSNLGATLKDLGKIYEAEASFVRAIMLKPDLFQARSNLLYLLSGFKYEPTKYLKEARLYGQLAAKSVESQFSNWLCEENPENLRIGFVSGDLKNHPVGFFLEELINQLVNRKIELFAYNTQSSGDDLTQRIKPHFSQWQSLVGISDKLAATKIHNDGVHILIDLSGHTAQNRLRLFAWRPAPVQISWLGYFASTGVTEIDYILGDRYVTPINEANHFTEKIWQLPGSYLCFSAPKVDVDVESLPALNNGRITFGSFNRITRVNDNVVATWSRILIAIPNAVLFVKDKNFGDKLVRESFCCRFEFHGISRNRLILEGASPRLEYLKAYNRVDIALSPFPYGGGTTSVEGLWMGVPVITIKGSHFLSHLGESIAHNTGLSDWIASDEEEYVAKAIAFSADLDSLARLRSRLREQVLSAPLCDAKRFASNFEAALREMWKTKINFNQ